MVNNHVHDTFNLCLRLLGLSSQLLQRKSGFVDLSLSLSVSQRSCLFIKEFLLNT